MPTLTITKEWASGEILLEADLDFIKSDLETFFNTTGINDDNIQDAGITASSKIVDATINEDKFQAGSVTTAKFAADSITTVKILDGTLQSNVFAADAQAAIIPAGIMWEFAGSSTPSGWLLCDGSAISRTTYSALFTAISTRYGVGNGSTTFNIPDCRGRVRAGKDDMGGSPAFRLDSTVMSPGGTTLGATGGTQTHALTTSEIPPHHHTVAGTVNTTADGIGNAGLGAPTGVTAAGHTHTFTGSTPNTVGGSTGPGHLNMQPSVIMNVIIRT